MTYEEALTKLEAIVSRMESGQYSVDELAAQLQEAQRLIEQCREKLNKAETEITKILKKS